MATLQKAVKLSPPAGEVGAGYVSISPEGAYKW